MKMRPKTTQNIVKAACIMAGITMVNGGFATIPKVLPAETTQQWHYADIADLFAAAPVILRAKIMSATVLKAPPNASGSVRFYVEADVSTLIRSPQALPPRLAWLVDMVPDSRGKIPKLKKADVLIAALPVSGRPGEIRLAARDAQQFWSPDLETRVRAVVTNAAALDALPTITGIASAFHTAGTITGEGETQIFLTTVTGAPVSMTVLTRPGLPKRWAFSASEIVDDAAAPPAPDTFAWYRLACFLPQSLPDQSIVELSGEDANAARNDYLFIMRNLGPCARNRR